MLPAGRAACVFFNEVNFTWNRQPMVNQTWVFDTHFLNNEQKHVTSRKMTVFLSRIKSGPSSENYNFEKLVLVPEGLKASWYINTLLTRIGCNVKNMAFCCCVMKCVKHLDLHNSVNQYLSNACYKNHIWIKDPYKVQDRPINFKE